MTTVKSVSLHQFIFDLQLDKAALVLAAMGGLPFLVHMLPAPAGAGGPGAVWLPIFYAPLLAVIFFKPRAAFLPALLAPALNRLITGRPELMAVYTLTFELTAFVALLVILHKSKRIFGAMGAVAYLQVRFFFFLVFKVFLNGAALRSAGQDFLMSAMQAWPGICALMLIGYTALRFKRDHGR